MRRGLSTSDLLECVRVLQSGLSMGQNWQASLKSFAETSPRASVKTQILGFLEEVRLSGLKVAAERRMRQSKSTEEQMFFVTLQSSSESREHLLLMISRYRDFLRRFEGLKKTQRNLLSVCRLQAIFGLGMGLLLGLGLPLVFSSALPSFISLGRPDMLLSGLAGLIVGSACVLWMCELPGRQAAKQLNFGIFVYQVSLLIQGGLEFRSAWNQSLAGLSGSKPQMQIPQKLREREFEYLCRVKPPVDLKSWRELLRGIQHSHRSGQGLVSFLSEFSEEFVSEFSSNWEFQLRKTSVVALLPLGLIVFPSSVYLLLGPQLMLFLRDFRVL